MRAAPLPLALPLPTRPPATPELRRAPRAGSDRSLVLALLEPPSLNTMLELARRKTTRGPHGTRLRQAQSRYWVEQQEYQAVVRAVVGAALLAARQSGRDLPPRPWPRWRIVSAHYRLHQRRDPLELLAGLKWGVDALVQASLVVDDNDACLVEIAAPTQCIARQHRGVTLVVAPVLSIPTETP